MNVDAKERRLSEAWEFLNERNFSKAVTAYKDLAHRYPCNVLIWFQYGCAAAGTGQIDLLEYAWRKALELEPNNSELLLQMGHRYQALRKPERARTCFHRAAAANPHGINPRIALAIFFEQNHRLAEAREAIASCLSIDQRDDQARYFVAFLDRREDKLEQAERGLRDLIASNPKHQYVQYASRYDLADVLNRTGRFDEAMAMLAEAKGLVRALADTDAMLKSYDQLAWNRRRTMETLPANILQTWSKQFPEKSRATTPEVAFLGGHPRSGTTVLEQILSSHPRIAALDEPTAFYHTAAGLLYTSPQLGSSRLNMIRRRYIESIRMDLNEPADGKLILDKNPSPTVDLPIWLRIFPELRVIIALRDPRDVVISCYFQNIPLNPVNVNFLSLERVVTHYANLMDVWLTVRQWEGFDWIETRYEDAVADFAKEGRRVTEFLGLTWCEAQARFYEKSNKVQLYSPTYHDASQPIYSRSVSRWRAFERHLAPIQSVLDPYCKALGYS